MISLLLAGLFTFVELNCENLFDTRHDSLKNDTEWLPEGANRWTPARYWKKVNAIVQEILACGVLGSPDDGNGKASGTVRLPDLVALCEVENDSVLVDLTRKSLLRHAGYKYVMTESPDVRGIDVALLYSPFTFQLVNHHSIRVKPLPGMRPTRDILYASGRVVGGDTLHVFVVHAPSRSGGEKLTEPYRMHVVECLMSAVDSLRSLSPDADVIVAGDFNDYARNKSIRYVESCELTEVSRNVKGKNGAKATYRFQGRWDSLDHIFVSPTMAVRLSECFIYDGVFLLEDDETYGGVKPRRNYLGPRYQRGFSDHLPLIARFILKRSECLRCKDVSSRAFHSYVR